jgi:hypothetical protein
MMNFIWTSCNIFTGREAPLVGIRNRSIIQFFFPGWKAKPNKWGKAIGKPKERRCVVDKSLGRTNPINKQA